jgi:tripartite-type tricarboxylate transporter receptor subunit TctC
MTLTRRTLVLGSGVLILSFETRAEERKSFPTALIRIILANSAGGAMDAMARAVADKISASMRQPVIVDARAGANGLIAANVVSQAAPNGYTLLFTNSSIMQNSFLRPDQMKMESLAPVALVAIAPNALAIGKSIPAETLAQFIALAKSNPDKFSYGSLGIGSTGQMLGEMLNKLTGAHIQHIPYKGEPPMLQDLLGGQISAAYGSAGTLGRQAAAGKCKLLAVGNTQRLKEFSDVPTFSESGFPSMNFASGWFAVFAPRNTPAEVVSKLSMEISGASLAPDIVTISSQLGFESKGMPASDFAEFLQRERDKWGEIIKATDIKIQ